MRKIFDSLRDWHIVFTITLLIVLVFGRSLTYEFTGADDTQLLVVNQEFLGNLANIPRLFSTDVFISMPNSYVFYRPLFNLLFMIELQFEKDGTWLFHLTNILLHLGCSVILYFLLRELKIPRLTAGMAACIFCVHPINTSAVVWIPGRNDTLLALFILSSFLFFLRWMETKKMWQFLCHWVLFLFALLTKESAVFFPLLCLSYGFYVRRDNPGRGKIILLIITYAIATAVWIALRSLVHQAYEIHYAGVQLISEWLKNLPALALYFGKVFLPFNLSIYPNFENHSLMLGGISIVMFIGLVLVGQPHRRAICWGFAWFLLFLVPTLMGGTIFYEHRAYCAAVGVIFALTQLQPIQAHDFSKMPYVAGFGILILLLSIFTILHAAHFQNRLAFATSAYRMDPSIDDAYLLFAGTFIDGGDVDGAVKILQTGISRNQNMMMAHRMLGDIYANRGNYSQAAQEYKTSLRIEPLHLYTYINYGKLCLQTGNYDQAVQLWKTSVAINPEFILGYYYLTNFYVHTKTDPDSAMIYAREIQRHGAVVMPELLESIEAVKNGGK
jgi:tetratricopeptide (TPR) repeat protein